jgi:hypothetical protein
MKLVTHLFSGLVTLVFTGCINIETKKVLSTSNPANPNAPEGTPPASVFLMSDTNLFQPSMIEKKKMPSEHEHHQGNEKSTPPAHKHEHGKETK